MPKTASLIWVRGDYEQDPVQLPGRYLVTGLFDADVFVGCSSVRGQSSSFFSLLASDQSKFSQADSLSDVFANVKQAAYEMPAGASAEAGDLIKGLLQIVGLCLGPD
jgi:hypothetical protein